MQSVWSFHPIDESLTLDDELNQLLSKRDLSLVARSASSTTTKMSKKKAKPVQAKKPATKITTKTWLPELSLEEIAEAWYDTQEDDEALSEAQAEHIQGLLQSYLKDEDDEENIRALRRSGLYESTVVPKEGTEGDEAEQDSLAAEDEDKLDGQTAENPTERYFQRRVAIEPAQVLRYAYAGEPLWITSPNPLEEGLPAHSNNRAQQVLASGHHPLVPMCETCGSARVFECQLMPALLSHVPRRDGAGPAVPATTAAASQLQAILGEGLDFGVVAIWSCPLSCVSREGVRLMEEVAVMQPPPDIG